MSEPKWTPAQRAAIEDRGGALRQNGCSDRAGCPAHHRPGASCGCGPSAHRHLYQCGGGRAAGPHRAGASEAQPGGTRQWRTAPPADAAAARTHLHHRCLLSGPAAQALSGAGYPAGFFPRRPRQCGAPAGLCPERDAGKCLPRPGFLRLCRPLRQGPHRPCGGGDDPACLRFPARPARLRQKAGRISGSVAGGKRLCRHLLA